MIFGRSREAAVATVPVLSHWQLPLSRVPERPAKRPPVSDASSSAAAAWASTRAPVLPSLTGLLAWYDASVTASMGLGPGDTIQSMADQSGNANHLVAGTIAPNYLATGFNSRPSMSYSDAAALQSLNKASVAFGTGNTLTIFAVATLGSDITYHTYGRLLSYTASGASHDYDNIGSFTLNRNAATDQLTFTRGNPAPISSPTSGSISYATPKRIIFTLKSDGTAALYINGSATTAAITVNNFATPGFLSVGGSKFDSSIGAGNYSGEIGEIGIATGYHDATTVALLDTYLKNKWGL